jgi:Tfp pilus assembly protein PilN
VRMRRELTICGGLAAAAVAVWVVGLFLQLSSLESQYASLKEQEKAVFRHVVPEEPTIINPAAQLQQKLDALRKDCELFTCFNPNLPGPLEVLSLLSRQIPATGNLRLHEMLIAGGSVRITGTCDSFATFGDWQRLLEKTPGLRLVDAPQPQKSPESQKVEFKVSLSTTEKKAS